MIPAALTIKPPNMVPVASPLHFAGEMLPPTWTNLVPAAETSTSGWGWNAVSPPIAVLKRLYGPTL